MKGHLLSVFIFAIAVLLSSAFPEGKENDGTTGLLEPQNPHARDKFLQKKKPTVKIPAPNFSTDDDDGDDDDGQKSKSKGKKGLLDGEHRRRNYMDQLEPVERGNRGRSRGRHFVGEDTGRGFEDEGRERHLLGGERGKRRGKQLVEDNGVRHNQKYLADQDKAEGAWETQMQ